MPMSILFIVLYVAYVIVVFYQDRYYAQEANTEVARKAALAVDMTELSTIDKYGDKPKDNSAQLTTTTSTGSEVSDSLMSYDFEG